MLEDEKEYWMTIKQFWREEDLSCKIDGPATALEGGSTDKDCSSPRSKL